MIWYIHLMPIYILLFSLVSPYLCDYSRKMLLCLFLNFLSWTILYLLYTIFCNLFFSVIRIIFHFLFWNSPVHLKKIINVHRYSCSFFLFAAIEYSISLFIYSISCPWSFKYSYYFAVINNTARNILVHISCFTCLKVYQYFSNTIGHDP